MPRISRFKRRDSDRSGFKFFEIELVKEGPLKVAGDEFDQPPPSRLPLGGEGDSSSSGDQRATSDFSSIATTDTATGLGQLTYYITAAGGITPSFSHPWMQVTGSNSAVAITASPQVVGGQEGNYLTLQCVDSSITLSHGTGLNLMGSSRFVMTSGSVITLYYSTANNVWNESSRSR